MAISKQNKAYFYALSAVAIWTTVATAFKISLKHLDFFQLLWISSITSALALLLIIVVQGKLSQLKQINFKDLVRASLLGLLNPFIYYLMLFKSYSILPAQEAQPLNYTWTIMLVLLSVPLLGQKIGLRSLIAILVSFFGVVVISTRGDLLALQFSNP